MARLTLAAAAEEAEEGAALPLAGLPAKFSLCCAKAWLEGARGVAEVGVGAAEAAVAAAALAEERAKGRWPLPSWLAGFPGTSGRDWS